MNGKPLLLIDVDGPLNPWANSNNQLRKGKQFHRYKLLGYTVWLDRWHGDELSKLADVFELTWCTTWEHEANTLIGPRIGLPELPVIEFEPSPVRGSTLLHWKMAGIRVHVDGRPFAWVDDELSEYDEQYLFDVHESPVLLRKIDPAVGLAEADFTALRAWAEEVAA